MDINWEEMAEESKGKSEETYQRKQAEVLLRSFYPQLSLAEAMHALLKGDHVFVYHIGFFLEKYGSVEWFANYATESRHF